MADELDALIAKAGEFQSTASGSIDEMRAAVTKEIETHQSQVTSHLRVSEGLLEKLVDNTHKEVTQYLDATKAQVSKLAEESAAEIEAFKRKVRIDVVNEVPTTFWSTKAKGHFKVAAVGGVLFALCVGGGLWWLESQAIGLVAEATSRIVGDREQGALLAIVPITFLTLPALAFAWVLRHLSRIIIQNLSLQADANLRATITSTFRALAGDRPMSEAELAIALQALFRPIDAKEHAEIAPPSLAELLKMDKP